MVYFYVDNDNQITYVNMLPFDSVHGERKSKEELELKGFFTDVFPEPIPQDGKVNSAIMYRGGARKISSNEAQAKLDLAYNRNLLYYEYYDIQPEPPSQEDIQAQFNIDIDYRLSKLELGI